MEEKDERMVVEEQLDEMMTPQVDGPVTEEDSDGAIQISNTVLSTLVKKYTLGVEGVLRFQNQSLMDGMLDILSKRAERSLTIETTDNGAVITVTVVMRFGVRIPQVAHEIQKILKTQIEELTGYTVSKVNVNVSDLEELPKEETKPQESNESQEANESGEVEAVEQEN